MSYKEWIQEVDLHVLSMSGVSVHDLPDFSSRDWYDDGTPPVEAAREVLRQAGFPEEQSSTLSAERRQGVSLLRW